MPTAPSEADVVGAAIDVVDVGGHGSAGSPLVPHLGGAHAAPDVDFDRLSPLQVQRLLHSPSL